MIKSYVPFTINESCLVLLVQKLPHNLVLTTKSTGINIGDHSIVLIPLFIFFQINCMPCSFAIYDKLVIISLNFVLYIT